MSRVPLGIRHFLVSLLKAVPDELYDATERFSQPIFRKYGTGGRPSQKFARLAQLMASQSFRDLYCQLISHWKDPEQVVIGCNEPSTLANTPPSWMQSLDMDQYMMVLDLQQYLPDDILTKVDRASMSVGLEARVPLLDHRVVQFARSLPQEYRVRYGERKWLLREVLRRHLSNELIDRPKMGFGVPIKHWLRGALRGWAEELLDERRLRDEGFFEVEMVRSRWVEHLRGDRDWHAQIWDILMFQSWLEARKAVCEAKE
jgi:asparagine synthase (glutamine-hydrolysing)